MRVLNERRIRFSLVVFEGRHRGVEVKYPLTISILNNDSSDEETIKYGFQVEVTQRRMAISVVNRNASSHD